jgi:hypothetical protein
VAQNETSAQSEQVAAMDQNTIRFVTANYHQLQGLRLVPLGLFLALWGLLDLLGFFDPAGFVSGGRARVLTHIGIAFWVGLLLALAAPVYYRYRYGSVDPLDRGSRNRWITAAVIGFFVLLRIDRDLQWPVALHLLLVSLSLFITVWRDGRIRRHYLAPALVWLAVSFLPAFGASPTTLRMTLFGLGGLTLIGCGIGDHLLLTRTLAKPRTTDDAPIPATV